MAILCALGTTWICGRRPAAGIKVAAISGLSPLTLGIGLAVVVVSYVVIVAAARRSFQEMIWTLIPALLLGVLLFLSARASGWIGP